jgi:uncharacterized protein YqeY
MSDETMTLEQRINQRMKDAMRAKDGPTKDLMRMIKSEVTKQITSKQHKGQEGDELWLMVIEAYVKSSQKALIDYEAIGDEGAEHATQIRWEIEALQEYLPKRADEATTEAWVSEVIESMGGAANAKVGAVMGAVMKAHKGEVEPALVRAVAERLLS